MGLSADALGIVCRVSWAAGDLCEIKLLAILFLSLADTRAYTQEMQIGKNLTTTRKITHTHPQPRPQPFDERHVDV